MTLCLLSLLLFQWRRGDQIPIGLGWDGLVYGIIAYTGMPEGMDVVTHAWNDPNLEFNVYYVKRILPSLAAHEVLRALGVTDDKQRTPEQYYQRISEQDITKIGRASCRERGCLYV